MNFLTKQKQTHRHRKKINGYPNRSQKKTKRKSKYA